MANETLIQDALDACNVIRADLGLPPVTKMRKGRRVNACSCPVARTIAHNSMHEVSCCSSRVSVDRQPPRHLESGHPISQFILAFDGGLVPELDEWEQDE